MTDHKKHLDFEINKEHWNKYSLSDGSKLKTRVMLESVVYIKKDGKKNYSVTIKNFTVILCDPSLQGIKNTTKWTQEQIQKGTEVENSQYDTISYEANEYLLDDGVRILIHTNITKISRTKLFDNNGDRIYNIQLGVNMTITPPSPIV